MLFAAKECLKVFFGEKWWLSVVSTLLAYFLTVYGVGNLKTSYSLATSVLRYFVYMTDFVIVIAATIFVRIKYKSLKKDAVLPPPATPALKDSSTQGEA